MDNATVDLMSHAITKMQIQGKQPSYNNTMNAEPGLASGFFCLRDYRPGPVIVAVITFNDSFETFISMKSSFNDLFSGGASVWLKIAGTAIVAPAIVFGVSRKMARQGNELFSDLPTTMFILVGTSVVGAFLGASLSMKDVVAKRIEDGKHVNWFLRLFFARGILTVLAWVPFFIVVMVFVLNILGI